MKEKLLRSTLLSIYPGIEPTRKRNRKKSGKKDKPESGRSMVEMLGVLAVIGVLTIGGVIGYKVAMRKWRANETVNELNTRAHTYLEVLARTGNIGGDAFGEKTRLGYPVELSWDGTVSPQELEIELRGVETGVCRELVNSSWLLPKGMLVGEEEATVENCEQAEVNGLTFVFETEMYGTGSGSAGGEREDSGICENGSVYLSHEDNPCVEIKMNKTTCKSDSDCTRYRATCCIDAQCVSGEVDQSMNQVKCEPNDSCVKNTDCENGEYCNLTGSHCFRPHTGTCAAISGKRYLMVNGKIFRQSQNGMQWWAAENWCKAQGMRLITLSDIGCDAEYGTCRSEALSALRAAGISGNLWTGTTATSCYAWNVNSSNYVYRADHDYDSPVLCVGS